MAFNLQQNIPRESYVIGRTNNTFAYLKLGNSNTFLAVNYNILCTLLPSYNLVENLPPNVRVIARSGQNKVICYYYQDNEYRSLSVQDILQLDFSCGEPRDLLLL